MMSDPTTTTTPTIIKRITPTGLISSIILLSTFLGVAFGVKETFVTKAEAAEIIVAQQQRAAESDLQIINLEIQYQEDKLKAAKRTKIRTTSPQEVIMIDEDITEIEKRLRFLYEKRLIIEKYQLELNK